MNNVGMELNSGLGVVLAIGTSLLSLITTVVWLVVGWRAMRAHEQLAEYLRNKQ